METIVLPPFVEAVAGMILLCFVIMAVTWSFACLFDSVKQLVVLVRFHGERSLVIMAAVLSVMGVTACGFLSYMAFSILFCVLTRRAGACGSCRMTRGGDFVDREEAEACLKSVYRAAYQAEACKRCTDMALMGFSRKDALEEEKEDAQTEAFLKGILSSIDASAGGTPLPSLARLVEAVARDDVATIPFCSEARAEEVACFAKKYH